MYPFLHNFFQDRDGTCVFNPFSIWHFIYLLLTAAAVGLIVYYFKGKEKSKKDKILKIFASVAFGLYMADFFLMPFAYGEIDVDKLPFHSCTLLSIACFLSCHVEALKKYRINFATFAFLSNLMYIVYPSGVAGDTAFTYRVIQTMLFHCTMVAYGLLVILFDEEGPQFKHYYRHLIILGGMTVWALIGNTLYSGEADGYSRDFNWFFIKADPFGLLPESVAPFIAPILNFIAFFGLEMIICYVYQAVKKAIAAKKAKALTAEEKEPAIK